jgi:CSLREA domain-containing protein
MSKVMRLSIPFLVTFLFLGIIFFLLRTSGLAIAAPSPSRIKGEIVVNTLEDELNHDGDCSLREAIQAANTNAPVDACPAGDPVITDTISFDVAGIITVTNQLLVTEGGPLVIDGGNVITVSGGGTTRVWEVYYTDAHLTLLNLTTENGHVDGADGAGILNFGILIISNSRIINNIANGYREELACYGYGGGIMNTGTVILTDSTLSGNHALCIGGAISNFGDLMVTNSTFNNNIDDDSGGAIYGGAVVVNSTFSGNHAMNVGGAISAGTLTMTNSTLSGNYAYSGGGGISGSAILTNTIVANSPYGGDCSGKITDGGHNLDSDGTCGLNPAKGSLPKTDPLLGPLQDNGGPTWTHALLWGSPAIDAGDNAQCPPADQRGVPRPLDGDGDGIAVCDIGSYELEGPTISPTMVTITGPGEGFVGQSYPFTATIEPISTTLPLKYIWLASNQVPVYHTSGLTDTVNYTWKTPGLRTITVIASNLSGSVTASHMITLTIPYEIYLPLFFRSVAAPLGSSHSSSSPEAGVLLGLVMIGMVGRWKKSG